MPQIDVPFLPGDKVRVKATSHEAAVREITVGCGGKTVVMLIPSRTDTIWWHRDVMCADEIRFVKGRLKFGEATNRFPRGSAPISRRPLRQPGGAMTPYPQCEYCYGCWGPANCACPCHEPVDQEGK